MKPNKQIISAIVLAPVIVLLISVYSSVALGLMDNTEKFLYDNFFLYTPISILSTLILIALTALPTVFVTRKFGIKPVHTVLSCVIIYVLYTVIPLLPVAYIEVSGSTVAIGLGVSLWTQAVGVSLSIGAVMFIFCFIARRVKVKSSFTETDEEKLWYNRIACIIITVLLFLYFRQFFEIFRYNFIAEPFIIAAFLVLLPAVTAVSLFIIKKRIVGSLVAALSGMAICSLVQAIGIDYFIGKFFIELFLYSATLPVMIISLFFMRAICKYPKRKRLIIAFVLILFVMMTALWAFSYAVINMTCEIIYY